MEDFNNDPWMTVKGLLILVITAVVMLLMMASCSTIRYVENTVEVHDTVTHVRIVKDSIKLETLRTDTFLQHDSIRIIVTQNEKGGIIRTDREAYFWREAWHNSEMTQIELREKNDSLRSAVDRMQNKKEIVKQEPPTVMQKLKLKTWWVLLIIVILESTLLYLIHYATKKTR